MKGEKERENLGENQELKFLGIKDLLGETGRREGECKSINCHMLQKL